jgi:hypothetical protein
MTAELWPGDGSLQWRLVTDGVMGGMSSGTVTREEIGGRSAIRMRGDVSLEHNGGFIQIALDLATGGQAVDASRFKGVAIDACGNGERYGAHLRSTETTRPQQSWRSDFVADSHWQTVQFPFKEFEPHRIERPLDTSRLRRIGIVAIGRAFVADVAIARLAFY